MKSLTLSFFLLVPAILSAQFYEHTEDRGFNNRITNVLNVGDSLSVFAGNFYYGIMGQSGAYVYATDTLGNKLWEQEITGVFDGQDAIADLVLTTDNKIVVFGSYGVPCDTFDPVPLMISRLDLDGNITLTTYHEIDLEWWPSLKKSVVLDDKLIFASGTTDPGNWGSSVFKVFCFDLTGNQLLWAADWYVEAIEDIARYGDSIAVFSDDQLVILNDQGMRVDSLSYSVAPLDVATFRDSSLFLLWGNGVSELNTNFELQPVIDLDDDYTPNTILTRESVIYLWDGQELRMYNSDYGLQESTAIDLLPYFDEREVLVNESTFAIAGAKKFEDNPVPSGSYYSSGAYALYDTANDTATYHTDVAVRHLELLGFNAFQTNNDPILFNFYTDVGGYVVNTGEEVLTNVNINYLGDLSVSCGIDSERLVLSDINVAPGDSIYFTMEGLSRTHVYSSDGNYTISFCVFSSEPSNLYDRNETNDADCVSAAYGVGIEENNQLISSIYPNPANDQLNITLPNMNEPAQIQFLDARGALIFEEQVNRRTNLEFSVSDWPADLYLARVVVAGKVSAPVKFSVLK